MFLCKRGTMKKLYVIFALMLCLFSIGFGCSSSNDAVDLYTVEKGVITGLTEVGKSMT